MHFEIKEMRMEKQTIKGELNESGLPEIYMYVKNASLDITSSPLSVIVDTGSGVSLIKTNIANSLKLEIIGKTKILRPVNDGFGGNMNKYNATLIIGEKLHISDVNIGELKQESYPCDLLLGMDIVKYCSFYYDPQNRSFELTFDPMNFAK